MSAPFQAVRDEREHEERAVESRRTGREADVRSLDKLDAPAELIVVDEVGPGRGRAFQAFGVEIDGAFPLDEGLQRRPYHVPDFFLEAEEGLGRGFLKLLERFVAPDRNEVDALAEVGQPGQVVGPRAVDMEERGPAGHAVEDLTSEAGRSGREELRGGAERRIRAGRQVKGRAFGSPLARGISTGEYGGSGPPGKPGAPAAVENAVPPTGDDPPLRLDQRGIIPQSPADVQIPALDDALAVEDIFAQQFVVDGAGPAVEPVAFE